MWWKLLEIILGKIANPELVKQTGDLVQTAEQQKVAPVPKSVPGFSPSCGRSRSMLA
ncbi:hypothetical protein CCP4SC76_8000005 [Gammaproteobacteria bacterium]